MTFLDLIRTRRSIRRFKPDPVSAQQTDAIVEAALRAPSSRSLNPWRFVVVTDPETNAKLSRAKAHGSGFLKGAPLSITVLADPQECDVWVEDCSIAAIFIQLAAHDLGLGSCWAQIRMRPHDNDTTAEEYVKDVLDIPANMTVLAVIGIGLPAETPAGHARESLQDSKIHRNRFQA